jgi:hypothetical protein
MFAATVSSTRPSFPRGAGTSATAATDIDLLLETPAPATEARDAVPPAACPACAADTSPDDLFCNRCGHRLAGAS